MYGKGLTLYQFVAKFHFITKKFHFITHFVTIVTNLNNKMARLLSSQ